MSSLLSLFKILSIPVAIAALHQSVLFGLNRLNIVQAVQNLVLTSEDAARSLFLTQAIGTLLMTLFVGLPFLRYVARRREIDYRTWMMAWALVHLPTFGFSVIANVFVETHWIPLLSLIGSFALVTGLWWQMFYAERTSGTNQGV